MGGKFAGWLTSHIFPRHVAWKPHRFLRVLVILASGLCSGVGADSVTQNSGGQTTQDQELESVSDIAPSAIHWAIAVLLSVALVGGLLRVARVLQKTDSIISPARHAPDGMRPVQCGACHTMQHVTMHGRIFICFSCHSANRIVMDPSITVSEELPLVSATGPLRRFEFKREGEIFFQETSRAEIDEGEAEQLIAAADRSTAARANNATCVAADTHADNQPVAVVDLEAGETDAPTPSHGLPAPSLIGQQDPELISNHSITSKKSRMSRISANGMPTCVVCLEEIGNMVLLPCAHGGVCDGCITRIAQNRASGGAHCPTCRSNIETLVKIHKVDGLSVQGVEYRIPMARAH